MESKQRSELYKALLSSPLGEDIKITLKELANSLHREGGGSLQMDKSFGLLNQAEGVLMALEHLSSSATGISTKESRGILPRSEGSQDK